MDGDLYTHIDALGMFLSGASSDGGAQDDPDLSLGNYRSSTHVEQVGFFLHGFIPGLVIHRASGANGYGFGSLEVVDGSQLRYTGPNDTPGRAVAIADTETKIIESNDLRKYIVVERKTSAELGGIATIKFVPVLNNVIGSSNLSGDEQAAGETKIRCFVLRAMSDLFLIKNLRIWLKTLGTVQTSDSSQLPASGAGTIGTTGTFADWPDTGYARIVDNTGSLREIAYYSSRTETVLTVPAAGRGLLGTSASAGAATDTVVAVPGIKIASEEPVSEQFTQVSNENDTVPLSGFSWYTGITHDTGISIGHLQKDEMIAVWLWLEVPAGATASHQIENILQWEFGTFDMLAVMEL